MVETVQSIHDSLPERDNLKVLNVGFGLGIVSSVRLSPSMWSTVCYFRSIDYSKRYQLPPRSMSSSSHILMCYNT